ncbi:hypothetical protein CEXT_212121 [Caerostris extrusa]|uniref:Uncharacterized protein n=1 Tax=Caerostris extrusa TaxID=172846 RepID=A0AAV4V0H7_CAEEX|nr:hypothetical protein CEXT_212121 [Caerostris extrusa]
MERQDFPFDASCLPEIQLSPGMTVVINWPHFDDGCVPSQFWRALSNSKTTLPALPNRKYAVWIVDGALNYYN